MERDKIFLTLLIRIGHILAVCYTPLGLVRNNVTNAASGDYLPCDASANVSMCCALGPNRATNGDRCIGQGTASPSKITSL